VVATGDCETGAVTQSGWINLQTGVFTAGPPPAGAVACGNSQSIQVSGVFCDVLADGTVVGLVLVEYHYAEDGSIESVRLVNATTGETYLPQGEVTVCPGGGGDVFQHEEVLCDHLPTGGSPTSDATFTATAVTPTAAQHNMGGPVDVPLATAQQFFNGQAISVGPGADNVHAYLAGQLAATPECGTLDLAGTSQITVSARITNTGTQCGCGLWGQLGVWNGNTPINATALGVLGQAGTPDGAICAGEVVTATVTATVSNTALAAGTIRTVLNVQTGADTTGDGTGCPQNTPGVGTTYTLDQYSVEPVTPVTVLDCALPGGTVQFLRKYIQDAGGNLIGEPIDRTLDGDPYDVQGEVGNCPVTSECEANTCQTHELCDPGNPDAPSFRLTNPTNVSSGAFSNGVTWNAVTFSDSTGASQQPRVSLDGAGSAEGLWWGGTASFPNDQMGGVRWTFGSAQLTEFSVAMVWTSAADVPPNIIQNTTQLPVGVVPVSLPPGYSYDPATRRVSVDQTRAADGTNGPNCQGLLNPTIANAARFRTTAPITVLDLNYLGARVASCGQFGNFAFGAIQIGGAIPAARFLRTVCRDCTGAVVSSDDRLMDGVTAYFPTANFGPCVTQVEPTLFQHQQILCDLTSEVPPEAVPVNAAPNVPTWTMPQFGTAIGGVVPGWPGGFIAFQGDGPVGVQSAYKEFTGLYPGATYELTWRIGQGGAGSGLDPRVEVVASGTGGAPVLAASGPVSADAIPDGSSIPAPPLSFVVPDDGIVRLTFFDRSTGNTLNDDAWAAGDLLTPTDVPPAPGAVSVPFWRKYIEDATGALIGDPIDFTLDGDPYEVQGEVVVCAADSAAARQLVERCGCDEQPDGTIVRYVELWSVDPADALPPALVGTWLDGDFEQPYTPTNPVDCPGSASGADLTVIERCGCDEQGDGTVVRYVELWSVDPTGTADPALIGTWLDGDFTQPYVPVNPIDCPADGGAAAEVLQTGARNVTGIAVQDLKADHAGLQSVTLTVLAGTALATLTEGASVPFPAGTSHTWTAAETLSAASFAGADAAANYLLVYTWRN
jgi:hypothetical protein